MSSCAGKEIQPEGGILRTLFRTLLFVVTGLPTLFGFLPGNAPIQFPPYLPEFMQLFASWTKPNEIIASDMLWAVAWYSDRKSLWLPTKLKTLIEFYNLRTLGAPIAGIYLTPVSRDLGYASQISDGEYKEWLPLILADQKALEDFPLRLVVGGCRWSMPLFQRYPAMGSKTVSESAPRTIKSTTTFFVHLSYDSGAAAEKELPYNIFLACGGLRLDL
jgi:hypothetical protein